MALPPLDVELARDLMRQTRIYNLLKGYRDRPTADLEAIADALVRLSQLVVDIPAVRELDVNPLLADETGIIALDARISIEPCADRHALAPIRGSRSGPTQINGRRRSRPRKACPC